MTITLAYLHYLALALGLGSLWVRGLRMREARVGDSPAAILTADNWWGVAALLWLGTGLLRAFAGFEKGSAFYLENPWFWIKMACFGFVFLMELWPMTTFIGWRLRRHGSLAEADLARLRRFTLLNQLQFALTLLIPLFAVLMARRGFF